MGWGRCMWCRVCHPNPCAVTEVAYALNTIYTRTRTSLATYGTPTGDLFTKWRSSRNGHQCCAHCWRRSGPVNDMKRKYRTRCDELKMAHCSSKREQWRSTDKLKKQNKRRRSHVSTTSYSPWRMFLSCNHGCATLFDSINVHVRLSTHYKWVRKHSTQQRKQQHNM